MYMYPTLRNLQETAIFYNLSEFLPLYQECGFFLVISGCEAINCCQLNVNCNAINCCQFEVHVYCYLCNSTNSNTSYITIMHKLYRVRSVVKQWVPGYPGI